MIPSVRHDRRCATLSARARAALYAILLALAAPAFAAGKVTLAWDAVNNASVRGYVVHYGPSAGNYNGSVDVGNITTASVTNLTEGATYHFAVAAYDTTHAEGALSKDVSGVVAYGVPVAGFTASTTSGPAPLGLNFTNSSTGSITSYSWTFGDGTTSTVANPAKVYSTAGTYTVALKVTGPGGSNTSTRSNYITVTAGSDTTPPSAPGTPTATVAGSTQINLSWGAATDNVGVTGYRVERCTGAGCSTFAQIATSTGTTFSNTGLAGATTYRYRVRATDAKGNLGAYSAIAQATTTSAADTTPPSAPGTPTATPAGSTQINLGWGAATDNVGVTGYRVERCTGAGCSTFAQIATSTGTTFSNTGLAAATTYRYRVRATDAKGNLGAYSGIAQATTTSAGDTIPPSTPGTPTATATGPTVINLRWGVSTDNVGVTGYRVERCTGAGCSTFTLVAMPSGAVTDNFGLAASTTYRYRVRAADAAGNLSGYSSVVTATTRPWP